jgi:hypothetical protein
MRNYLRGVNGFKILSLLTGLLYLYLAVDLFFFPGSALQGFGIQENEGVYFIARRVAMLMLGFTVLLFLARDARPSFS